MRRDDRHHVAETATAHPCQPVNWVVGDLGSHAVEPAESARLLTPNGRLLTPADLFQEDERRPLERFGRSGGAAVSAEQATVVISGDFRWAFTSDGTQSVDLDAETLVAKPLQLQLRPQERIVKVNIDGRGLVTSSPQGVRVFLLDENQELLTAHEFDSPHEIAAWSIDPLQVVTSRFTRTQLADRGRENWLWKIHAGEPMKIQLDELPQSSDCQVAFSPQGRFVALLARGQCALIRSCENDVDKGDPNAAGISPLSGRPAARFRVTPGRDQSVYDFHGRPSQLCFSPNGRWVVVKDGLAF